MKLAWYVSLVAQALLALTLWEPERRNWFVRYLVVALAISAIRIQFSSQLAGRDYWYAWTATEPLLIGLQFLAVEQATRGTSRDLLEIAIIMAVSFTLWAFLLSSDNWPILRRASLLMKQAGTFGCWSLLFIPLAVEGERAHTNVWMFSYFTINGLSLVAAQATNTQASIQMVSTVHLSLVALLYSMWTAHTLWAQFRPKVQVYARGSSR